MLTMSCAEVRSELSAYHDEELSIGDAEAPRHAPITPAAQLELMFQLYDAGSLAPATL